MLKSKISRHNRQSRRFFMKNDLYNEMKIRKIDWLILSGNRSYTPDIIYILGDAALAHPIILIEKNNEPIIIYEPMEKEEALKTGGRIYSREEILPRSKAMEFNCDKDRQTAFYANLFEKFSIKGNILFCGNDEINNSFILHEIVSSFNEINMVSYEHRNIFHQIRQIKEKHEIDHIRDVSKKTVKIFSGIDNFLSKGVFSGENIKDETGKNITLGDIRRLVLKIMAEENLTFEQVPIIAMGKDGSSPHCRGNDQQELIQGQSIVMDISPKNLLSGYFSDMTRTICVGQPCEHLQETYDTVKKAYELSLKYIRQGIKLCEPDMEVSSFFRAKGHKVVMDSPGIIEGYTHSLGHGIGLNLHELPRVSAYNIDDSQIFQPNMVFTIEPGLYYESKNLGVRLEDTFCLNSNGELENLTQYPMNLQIGTH